jgi:hypothetical protein
MDERRFEIMRYTHKVQMYFPPGMSQSLSSAAGRLSIEEGAYVSKNALIVRVLGNYLDGAANAGLPDTLRVHLKMGTIEAYRALAKVREAKAAAVMGNILIGCLEALKANEANWVSILDFGSRRGWVPASVVGKTDTRIPVPGYRGVELRNLATEQDLSVSDTVELLLLYAPTLGLFAPPKKGN